MDKAQFWRLIEDAKEKSKGECEEQAELLKGALVKLPLGEIIAFGGIMDELLSQAYHWDLWGAACLINGGASDDGFEYFCRWLIAQGREVFETALAQPDSLAELIKYTIVWGDGQLDCESIGYVAMEAHEEVTGRELPHGAPRLSPSEPIGVKWEEDDLDAMFPKIAAKISAQE